MNYQSLFFKGKKKNLKIKITNEIVMVKDAPLKSAFLDSRR